jgi:CTP:molybdopterin cytidylyltransferase MocA
MRNLPSVTLVAALLAAGGGTRYLGATHKLHASLDGRSVLERSLANVVTSGVGPVIVVTGATGIFAPAGPTSLPVLLVHNPDWAEGQSTSIRVAVREAERRAADFLLIGLADQPDIGPDTWRAIADAPPEYLIVVASYDGRLGPHPVRLHRSLWPMLPTIGDHGARTLLRDHAALVHQVDCTGSAADIDTLEDEQRWKSS